MYDQHYLERLVADQTQESIFLEYKSAGSLDTTDEKKVAISRHISAMANAAGGLVIYGMKEDKNHFSPALDPINRQKFTKEWLEDVISSRITPKIDGVIIHSVKMNNDGGKVIYIVEVPQSTTAHQANDRCYYKRHNFKAEKMWDYEIRDIMNRVKYPQIKVGIELWSYHWDNEPQCHVKVFVTNDGSQLAKYINCEISIPQAAVYFLDDMNVNDPVIFQLDNRKRDIIRHSVSYAAPSDPEYGTSWYQPVLPKRTIPLDSSGIILNRQYQEHNIKWEVFADNAPSQQGIINLSTVELWHE